ncbi:MAG: M56 family metallopeptidase [Gillisia sp.]
MEAISIYILKSAGLLSLFYLVYILLLKNDTSFRLNRKFLIIGIIAAFIVPAAVFTKTIQVESLELAVENFNITEGFTETISTLPQEDPLNAWQIAGFIYFLGLSFFLIRFGFQLISLLNIIRNQPKLKESGITILHTEEAIPPFSFFKYIIVNPKLHSPEELVIILQHEKIHAAQNHSADVLLANLTTAVLWFNPLVWFYKKNILQNLEYIADKETVAKNISRKQYQETLLKVCLANFQPALSNSFYQSFIKKRILMLHKKSTSNNLWKMTAVLPLVLAFLLVFNVKTVAQVIPSKEKTAVTTTEKFSVSISKNSSPEDLEFAQKLIFKQNLMLEYEEISRSPEGLITSITINFLNKINNNSGSVSKNDPDGISSFVIFVNKNGETGVADAPVFSNEIKNPTDKVLAEIGLNPLFIINKKEYQAAELYGKHVHLKSGFVFISPNEASEIKKYGTKGKDGIILVAEGEIIADFSEEMKRVDLENKTTTLNYLQIVEGFKPGFLTVKKNQKNLEKSQTNKNKSSEKDEKAEKDTLKTEKDRTVMVIGTGARFEADKPGIGTILARDSQDIYAYQKGSKSNPITSEKYLDLKKPMYVLDGHTVEKDFDINSLNPEEIASMHVLKGHSATALYGEEAKDGVILITTKTAFPENSPKIFEIKSSFSDAQLDALKEAAKQKTDFKLNFKNIKRNSAGLISAIDVTLNGKGKKASASYNVEDGVPTIYVGEKKDGGVIVTSSPVK